MTKRNRFDAERTPPQIKPVPDADRVHDLRRTRGEAFWREMIAELAASAGSTAASVTSLLDGPAHEPSRSGGAGHRREPEIVTAAARALNRDLAGAAIRMKGCSLKLESGQPVDTAAAPPSSASGRPILRLRFGLSGEGSSTPAPIA